MVKENTMFDRRLKSEDFLPEDTTEYTIKIVVKYIFLAVFVIILLIVAIDSFYTVNAGERAIVVRLGKPFDTAQAEGLHFKAPIIDTAIIMDTKTHTLSFDNKQNKGDVSEYSSLFGASKDLQDVQISVVTNWHPDQSQVVTIYKTYGSQYEKNVIEPIVRETVKTVSAEFTAEELVTKRAEFSARVSSLLATRLAEKLAVFERFNVVNFEFSPEFTKAIELKVTAEQNALAAKNKLEQIKYEAEQRVAQAEGEAQAITTQINAIRQQGGEEYIKLKFLEKWDGRLSQVSMGGNSIPFINIPINDLTTQK